MSESPVSLDGFSAEEDFQWEISENGVTITGYVGKETDIRIPRQIQGLPVTSIGNAAFRSKNITNVVIPDSIISIGQCVFVGNKLTCIEIPNSVISIDICAFAENQLTSVTIPNSVASIEYGAFSGNRLTSVSLPDSVAFVGDSAFDKGTIVSGGPQQDGFFWSRSDDGIGLKITSYAGSGTDIQIPSQIKGIPVVSIGVSVFRSKQLTGVAIPHSVTSIEGGAFADNELTGLAIPDSVISIGCCAFEKNRLTDVMIPNSVTYVGSRAFDQGTSITGGPQKDGFFWTRSGDSNSIAITNYIGEETDVEIPAQIHRLPVTSIGEYAFWNKRLTRVVIPDSVILIGSCAFYKNHLTHIKIPDSVTVIGHGAFCCNKLTVVVIPNSVTSIGNSVFSDNQLTDIVIPNSVTSIGYNAFSHNQLTDIVIPNSVTSIGDSAFSSNQLASVIIGNSVLTIGCDAFFNNRLTNVAIPDSVVSIGKRAFVENWQTAQNYGNDVNFMEVKTGGIANGILYRSNSPLTGGGDKKIKEALAIRANINCVINLANSNSVIKNLSKDVPWYHKLVAEGNVICLPMTLSIPGVASNEKKLKTALQFMINHKGPYLIHCFAGIDRTGFVVMLLEALMGANLKEIGKTYLSAFLFDDSDSSRIESYHNLNNIMNQMKTMFHGENIFGINIQTATERYLLHDIRLSLDEITKLKNILSGGNLKIIT